MKVILLLMGLCCLQPVSAQHDSVLVRQCITRFFEGMHRSDTGLIRSTVDSACTLQSIAVDKSGTSRLSAESMDGFLQQVVSLKGQQLEERLLSFDTRVDGAMAVSWVPYRFYFNEVFSHCGVNVFTLIKRPEGWKILGITDTRRRIGCE
jgi:hypothetical protein